MFPRQIPATATCSRPRNPQIRRSSPLERHVRLPQPDPATRGSATCPPGPPSSQQLHQTRILRQRLQPIPRRQRRSRPCPVRRETRHVRPRQTPLERHVPHHRPTPLPSDMLHPHRPTPLERHVPPRTTPGSPGSPHASPPHRTTPRSAAAATPRAATVPPVTGQRNRSSKFGARIQQPAQLLAPCAPPTSPNDSRRSTARSPSPCPNPSPPGTHPLRNRAYPS